MTSPKEAQIKEQYDNTEPSGKAEQDAIKEAPDYNSSFSSSGQKLDWLDKFIYSLCMHSQKNTDGTITIVYEGLSPVEAKAAISQHIAEQVEAIIGEDEPEHFSSSKNPQNMGKNNLKAQTRNKFRAELRAKLRREA